MKRTKKLATLAFAVALVCSIGTAPMGVATRVHAEEPSVLKVACVGDSITAGSKSSSNATCSYPAQLQNYLDSSRYEVKNFGHSGAAALRDVTARTPYWTTAAYTNSLAYQPDIVIIMLGTNDVMCPKRFNEENYTNDLTDLVEVYQNLDSHPTIYLATPPTAFDTAHPEPLQTVAVPCVKNVAEATGSGLIDINTATATYKPDGLLADNIHPNDAGYLALAALFYEKVFGGTVVDVTVKTQPGLTVSLGGQKVVANEDGLATLVTGDGTKTLRVANDNGGFREFPVTVKGNTTVDCTALTLPDNLARVEGTTVLATVLREGDAYKPAFQPSNACDGNESTGWQLDTPYGYAYGIYVGYDFGEEKPVNTVELVLEQGSLPGGYVAEISSDGVTWTAIPDVTDVLENSRARITFEPLTTRYIRVRFTSGTTMYRPKVWEMRVTLDETDGFVPLVTYDHVAGDVTGDGTVDAADLTALARHVGGVETITHSGKLHSGDMDGSGDLGAADLTKLSRLVARIDQ